MYLDLLQLILQHCKLIIPTLTYIQILGELIVSRYVAESLTTDAGCLGHVGNCVQKFCRSWQRPMWPKRPASVVIDSAMYLPMISSPDINNVAMSLYNIVYLDRQRLIIHQLPTLTAGYNIPHTCGGGLAHLWVHNNLSSHLATGDNNIRMLGKGTFVLWCCRLCV